MCVLFSFFFLLKGSTAFECGVCKAVWPFKEVCKMALLTDEENKYFEDALFRNCPGCKCRVMRADPHNLRVQCPQCKAEKGKMYEFCWQCLKEWKGAVNSDRCVNEGCENPDLITLKTCPEIEFKDVKDVTGCPSIRACPTCGKLLMHNSEQCKNITCPDCKVEFCFVCLKLTRECCGKTHSYYSPCSSGVAPRQTSIPVRRK
uniref:RING-type domain-containing protein n=1 Tax=Neogobius melanostomus TaxID=47308 RepID=A0A8C6T4Z6_9GOBI